MAKKLGDVIFNDIDQNEYLNELYESILYNYSLALFNGERPYRDVEIDHALRFADILSKSTNENKQEQHKSWAQEIVSLLAHLHPQNLAVQHCLGSVLTSISNFRGMELRAPDYISGDILERVYVDYERGLLAIPAEPSFLFFRSQKEVYDHFGNQYFSYSGPTSMGKSFIMRMFIKEQILKGMGMNFAILVPTKALINEVSSKFIDDLKDSLATHDYRVVTSVGALSLQQQHNFILVLTPERLLYLLLDRPEFRIDYLFVDEAHKISSKDSRSPIYYKVIDLVTKRSQETHTIFSSPNIPNPQVYLGVIPSQRMLDNNKVASKFTPVSQVKYLIDLLEGKAYMYNDHTQQTVEIAKAKKEMVLPELIVGLGANEQSIVYCGSTSKAVDYALSYAQLVQVPTTIPNSSTYRRISRMRYTVTTIWRKC